MSKLSLEHIIRNIAEGKTTPLENPKISLEHAIKNVHESVGTIGTDKYQGTQFKTVKTITPMVRPGHNERAETASAARNVAKGKQSLTMQGKVSESAPSDMSGVTAATQCPSESGKKKVIKETPAPNYGNAAQVASWSAAEDGKKKVKESFGTMSGQGNEVGDYGRNTESGKKKVKEEVEQIDELSPVTIASYATKAEKVVSKIRNMLMKDQSKNSPKITRDLYNREKGIETAKKKMEEAAEPTGTVDRREIEFRPRKKDSPERKNMKYLGRPDDADPKSKKSLLGRTGSVTTRSGGYVDVDEEKLIPGKTPVVFEPVLNQVTPEGDMKAANKKHKKIVKDTIKEAMGIKKIGGKGIGALSAYSAADDLSKGNVGGATVSGMGMIPGPIGVGTGLGSLASAGLGALATGTETGQKIGKWIGDNVPGAKTAADYMRKTRDYIGMGDKSDTSSVVGTAQAATLPSKPAQPVPSNTVPAKPAQPVSATKQSNDYKIQKGDTLSTISKRSGVSMDKIAKDNNIKDINKIYSGSNLKINK